MKKRILMAVLCALSGMALAAPRSTPAKENELFDGNSITLEKETLAVRSTRISKPCKVMICADFHYTTDDERGKEFRCYSARMAKYGPQKMMELEKALKTAEKQKLDAVLLIGDILSFPSEAGVERLTALMKSSAVPCYYIAGNHDWHYEGVPGSDQEQRKEWIRKRLLPLYANKNPLGYTVTLQGIKFILVDNSIYEILPEQLEFLRKELSDGKPAVLCVHVPLYLPGRDYECGDPCWGKRDTNWKIERRQRWPESGPSATTFAFHRLAMSAPNLLGILAGHTHRQSLDIVNGRFQFVSKYRAPTFLNLLPSVKKN